MKKDSPSFKGELGNLVPEIYLSIDHLKKGRYVIHLTNREKVIKTINILKK